MVLPTIHHGSTLVNPSNVAEENAFIHHDTWRTLVIRERARMFLTVQNNGATTV